MTAHHDNELLLRPGNDYGNLYEQLYMYIQEKYNIYPIHGLCHNTSDIRFRLFVNRTLKMEILYIFEINRLYSVKL